MFQNKNGSRFSSMSYDVPETNLRMSSSNVNMASIPQDPVYAPDRSAAPSYGSRTSLLGMQDAPLTTRYLQNSASSSNLLGMGSIADT